MNLRLYTICALMLVAGCSRSADPGYYTLTTVNGQVLPGKPVVIKVERPGVDISMDRLQIMRMDSASHVYYDNAALWSEPFDKMIERVLAQDIEKRLPGSTVFTESGGIVAHADYTVDLEIRQFGIGAEGRTTLQAVFALRRTKLDTKPQSVILYGDAAEAGKPEVQALSRLLGQFADQIAADIRK